MLRLLRVLEKALKEYDTKPCGHRARAKGTLNPLKDLRNSEQREDSEAFSASADFGKTVRRLRSALAHPQVYKIRYETVRTPQS